MLIFLFYEGRKRNLKTQAAYIHRMKLEHQSWNMAWETDWTKAPQLFTELCDDPQVLPKAYTSKMSSTLQMSTFATVDFLTQRRSSWTNWIRVLHDLISWPQYRSLRDVPGHWDWLKNLLPHWQDRRGGRGAGGIIKLEGWNCSYPNTHFSFLLLLKCYYKWN